TWYASSGHSTSVPIEAARARTDAAIDGFRASEPGFIEAGASAQDLGAVNDLLATVKTVRRSFDDVQGTTTGTSLLSIDNDLLSFGESVARNLHDPEVGARVSRSFGLQRENGELAREASTLLPVLATGRQEGFVD